MFSNPVFDESEKHDVEPVDVQGGEDGVEDRVESYEGPTRSTAHFPSPHTLVASYNTTVQ